MQHPYFLAGFLIIINIIGNVWINQNQAINADTLQKNILVFSIIN